MTRANIEAERGRLGMTKKQTLPTYKAYISGARSIPSDPLEKLRDVSGKTIDYLLGVDFAEDDKTA